ncbi:pentatricopeptide repeat-containing protein At5g16640, mitochondrial-like [Phalaenopsis equestris]|uniref:pentatricopeptide repeat-containing protein At5g16640, mitochondrial-like n=1 Tax=Phalaenopsis equestris TaxID=78828 RepID=UPI0009E5B169|nr:pentatricopeptide repeat-containing protein At5g16640, mitochondrial-like [Phalaenopsis equestris]
MFSAIFHRRAAIESYLIAGTLAPFSMATVAGNSSTLPFSDPLLEQFLPGRTRPRHHLRLKLRLELLRHLNTALKTDPQCSVAASSLLSALHSAPLADLLCSLRNPRAALSFLLIAIPNTFPDAILFSCDVAFLIFSTEKLKTLAQDILSGLLHCLNPHRAVDLLSWAALHRSYFSRYHALHLVLRAFLGAGMVSEALRALAEIRRVGNTPSLSVHAILLRLLFRMGDSKNAWKLFRDMILRGPRPSVRIFNAMILGSCLKGRVAAGEGLFWLIPKYKLEPDACSFNIIMKANCLFGRVGNAFKLFDEMIDLGHVPTIVSYNILINVLCRQGRMEEARRWFDRIVEDGLETNIITYNVLLDGYVKAGQVDIAISTYEEMVKKGIPPDFYTFNILVSGHCKFRRDWKGLVQNLFRDALNDEVCTQMLISSLCWDGQMEDARLLMPSNPSDGLLPKVSNFNSIIAGYSKEGMEEEAINMYRVMVDEFSLVPSASTWQSLLLGLCRRGRLSEAKELLYEIVGRGFNVGISAFTIYIDGCFRFGKVSEAIDCLNHMESNGISLDVVGFSAYINGLCRAERMEKAQEVFNEIRRRGLIPNNFTYNSLISGLMRVGDIKEALKLEADMRCNGLSPDIFTTNIVINGFCLHRCLERADEEFRQMGWNGLYPDTITFNTLIAACYRTFDTGHAERYFELMALRDCKPDIFTYNIRIHSLCSRYRTPEAMKMVDTLISEGFTPSTVTHNTVMNGICDDSLGRAMILTGKLIKMAIVPNVVTVNLLLSHFCKQGLAERALIWGEKFKKVSFDFDDVTLCILDKANNCLRKESGARVTSGKGLFLEFLMHVAYELICNTNRSSKHKPLAIKGLVNGGFTCASMKRDLS